LNFVGDFVYFVSDEVDRFLWSN